MLYSIQGFTQLTWYRKLSQEKGVRGQVPIGSNYVILGTEKSYHNLQ